MPVINRAGAKPYRVGSCAREMASSFYSKSSGKSPNSLPSVERQDDLHMCGIRCAVVGKRSGGLRAQNGEDRLEQRSRGKPMAVYWVVGSGKGGEDLQERHFGSKVQNPG